MKDTSAPAFARPLSTGKINREGKEIIIDSYPQQGMSQHMFIATQCLAGILANSGFRKYMLKSGMSASEARNKHSREAYEYATALLKLYEDEEK